MNTKYPQFPSSINSARTYSGDVNFSKPGIKYVEAAIATNKIPNPI